MEGAAHHETVGCQGRVCCSKGENLSGWKIHQRRCGHLKSTDPTQTGWGGRTPHPGQHPSTPSHSAGNCFPDTQTLLRLPGQAGEAPAGVDGLQPEHWARLLRGEAQCPSSPPGPALSPGSISFAQAFIELLLCARHCAKLCLTQMDKTWYTEDKSVLRW